MDFVRNAVKSLNAIYLFTIVNALQQFQLRRQVLQQAEQFRKAVLVIVGLYLVLAVRTDGVFTEFQTSCGQRLEFFGATFGTGTCALFQKAMFQHQLVEGGRFQRQISCFQ